MALLDRTLARKIALSTTIFLIAIQAGGTLVLKFFGIFLPRLMTPTEVWHGMNVGLAGKRCAIPR